MTLEVLVALVQMLTLCVVGWYTIETYRLRITTQHSLSLHTSQVIPKVIGYFRNGIEMHNLYFVVENVGGTPAFDIRIEINPPYDVGEESANHMFHENGAVKHGIPCLTSKDKYNVLCGTTWSKESVEKVTNQDVPLNYTVKAIYKDIDGNKYEQITYASISYLFSFYVVSNKDEKVKLLDSINRNLSGINAALSNQD